ncbi:MAG: hypothetical protein H0V34_10020 [Gammaproteobacteria bacterium]|nr:hypothetical protein [Gammaproteobacteria bacterium]
MPIEAKHKLNFMSLHYLEAQAIHQIQITTIFEDQRLQPGLKSLGRVESNAVLQQRQVLTSA